MTDTTSPWQWMDQSITTEYVIATTAHDTDQTSLTAQAYGINQNEIFSIDHFFESRGRSYSRKVYGVMDFMADIGGFWGFLLPNFAVLANFYQQNAFKVDKIARSFRVKPKKQKSKNPPS